MLTNVKSNFNDLWGILTLSPLTPFLMHTIIYTYINCIPLSLIFNVDIHLAREKNKRKKLHDSIQYNIRTKEDGDNAKVNPLTWSKLH